MVSFIKVDGTVNQRGVKVANQQIKDGIPVFYFFFTWGAPWLARSSQLHHSFISHAITPFSDHTSSTILKKNKSARSLLKK